MTPLDVLWLFFILSSLQPLLQQKLLTLQRAQAIRALERRNGSRVITLIHAGKASPSSASPSAVTSTSTTPKR